MEIEKYKSDFISGSTYSQIAKKYDIDEKELRRMGREGHWFECRRKNKKDKSEKTNEQMLEEATRKLCLCLERAIEEIDSYVTTVKKKEKTVDYDDEGKKVKSETVIDSEEVQIAKGVVDRGALKQLIAALSALKGEECINDEDNGIFVIMSEEAKEYAK